MWTSKLRIDTRESASGFQYGKFANNLFSILKLLVTVPKMGKIHHISNMTFWGNFAIFETTAKNSDLERWLALQHSPQMQI